MNRRFLGFRWLPRVMTISSPQAAVKVLRSFESQWSQFKSKFPEWAGSGGCSGAGGGVSSAVPALVDPLIAAGAVASGKKKKPTALFNKVSSRAVAAAEACFFWSLLAHLSSPYMASPSFHLN